MMTKNADGSFTITNDSGTITLTRAQMVALLNKVPLTLLPRR